MAKFCRYCGSPVRGGANFCKNCGRALTRPAAQPEDTDRPMKAVPEPIPNAEPLFKSAEKPSQIIQPAPKSGSKKPAVMQNEPGKKKKSLSAASLINVILIILCLVLVFVGLRTIPDKIRDARIPIQPFGDSEYDPDTEEDPIGNAENNDIPDDSYIREEHESYPWLYGND